ncbi:hypothetical protein [Salinicola acroporae]|nr:hypothetical protein [Salinicola acroporae]
MASDAVIMGLYGENAINSRLYDEYSPQGYYIVKYDGHQESGNGIHCPTGDDGLYFGPQGEERSSERAFYMACPRLDGIYAQLKR